MGSATDESARGDLAVAPDGDDPSRSGSSAPSSSPSFCADPSSPKYHIQDFNLTDVKHIASRLPGHGMHSDSLSRGGAPRPDQDASPAASNATLGSPTSATRTPTSIPLPSSMPPPPSTPDPRALVTYNRADSPHGQPYGTKHTGPYYPYTHGQQPQQQPQPHQPQPRQSYQPAGARTMMTRQQLVSSEPSAATLQRANSAPPARALSMRRSVGLSSSDWAGPATAAGLGSDGASESAPGGAAGQQSSDPGDGTPGGSVITPYGFLPPQPSAPLLKPSWPTARLVSSRRSATAAFSSFAAAPTAALRITGMAPASVHASSGSAAATSGGGGGAKAPAAAARPAAPQAAPGGRATGAAGAAASAAQKSGKRFTSSRARCLVDNLAFLHRGNTLNPPINERINALLAVVLPSPSAVAQTLQAIPSPMAPPPPAPPPPPEATAHFDRALQQRRQVVVAQRSLADGGGGAAAEAAAGMDRWGSSLRRGGGGGGAGGYGPSFRSLSANSPWLGRAGEWADVGAGSVLRRGGAASPFPGSDGAVDTGGADSAWGAGAFYASADYTGINAAATAAAAAAAAATAAARHTGAEALHLQGVSYKAAKAATRALADMQRPGINLRKQARVEADYAQQQHLQYQQVLPPHQQQHPAPYPVPHPPPYPSPYSSPHPPLHPPQFLSHNQHHQYQQQHQQYQQHQHQQQMQRAQSQGPPPSTHTSQTPPGKGPAVVWL